jgi:hypothetical protein
MAIVKIQLRRGLSTLWTSVNPTLLSGEQGWETDTGKLKIGDGSTPWTSLPYTSFGNVTTVNGLSGDVVITAADLSDLSTEVDSIITAQKGAANGLAPLDGTSKISSTYLPSYVDDALEFANLAAFPVTGETGKIYVAIDTGKIYRWSGSVYAEISPSPGSTDAVPEGTTNLYFTNSRAAAAAPVQSVAGKTGTVTLDKSDVGLSNVDNTSDLLKPVSNATQTALNGKANTAHTHALSDLTQSGATSGQVPTWSGSAWVAQTPSGGGGGITNAQSIINALIYG